MKFLILIACLVLITAFADLGTGDGFRQLNTPVTVEAITHTSGSSRIVN